MLIKQLMGEVFIWFLEISQTWAFLGILDINNISVTDTLNVTSLRNIMKVDHPAIM